jgi:hypothetical protein
MTDRDDIIRMALGAGWNWPEVHTTSIEDRLERFFKLAYEAGAAAEREACAELAASKASVGGASNYPTYIAAAIRARGNK